MNAHDEERPSSNAKIQPGSKNSNHNLLPEDQRPEATRYDSNQSAQNVQSTTSTMYAGNVRGTWTGKIFVITGLRREQFPKPKLVFSPGSQRGRKQRPTTGVSPNKCGLNSTNGSPLRRSGLKRKRSGVSNSDHASTGEESPPDASQDHEYDGNYAGLANGGPFPIKRRKRGVRSQLQSLVASKAPSPELPLLGPEEDTLRDEDLPPAFQPHTDVVDSEEPDDEASRVYREIYEPLTKSAPFLAALAKFNPAQRSTDNLYAIAANTANALRIWQDEYLKLDQFTAPHAIIARKPALGSRSLVDQTTWEDQKEADLYDYIFDPKKIGRQDPLNQRVVRDASGRELRQRQRGRVGADTQLVNAGAANSEEDQGRRTRTRKPVSKYDGVATSDQQRRKRPLEYAENDQPAKRGRTGTRGGGRGGRGRGGRGGALSRRIQDLREASVGFSAASVSGEDESGSEAGAMHSVFGDSREASAAPVPDEEEEDEEEDPRSPPVVDGPLSPSTTAANANASIKRKGRPKGSKNLHARSDKGIPKGPRNKEKSKDTTTATPAEEPPSAVILEPVQPQQQAEEVSPAPQPQQPAPTTKTKQQKGAAPKSEKRSQSMTDWWARRKAAEAVKKAVEAASIAPTPKYIATTSSAPRANRKINNGGHTNPSPVAPSPAIAASPAQHNGMQHVQPQHHMQGHPGYPPPGYEYGMQPLPHQLPPGMQPHPYPHHGHSHSHSLSGHGHMYPPPHQLPPPPGPPSNHPHSQHQHQPHHYPPQQMSQHQQMQHQYGMHFPPPPPGHQHQHQQQIQHQQQMQQMQHGSLPQPPPGYMHAPPPHGWPGPGNNFTPGPGQGQGQGQGNGQGNEQGQGQGSEQGGRVESQRDGAREEDNRRRAR